MAVASQSIGKEVPNLKVFKIQLPSCFHASGNLLAGIAEQRAKPAYAKLRIPMPGLSVIELNRAKNILKSAENGELAENSVFFRQKILSNDPAGWAVSAFYSHSVNLDFAHKNKLANFFSQGSLSGEIRFKVSIPEKGDRYYLLKMDGEYLVATRDAKYQLDLGLSTATSLIHLRDMFQTCSIEAARNYAQTSKILGCDEWDARLSPIFKFVSSQGENPKMALLDQHLSEMAAGLCAVLCRTAQQLQVLQMEFPGVRITNAPSKGNFDGIQRLILYNSDNNTLKAALRSGAPEIFSYVARDTVDDDRHWQNSKKFTELELSARGIQKSF